MFCVYVGFAERAMSISSLVGAGSVVLWKVSLLSCLYICMVAMTVWVTAAEIRIPTVSYNTGVTKAREYVLCTRFSSNKLMLNSKQLC